MQLIQHLFRKDLSFFDKIELRITLRMVMTLHINLIENRKTHYKTPVFFRGFNYFFILLKLPFYGLFTPGQNLNDYGL